MEEECWMRLKWYCRPNHRTSKYYYRMSSSQCNTSSASHTPSGWLSSVVLHCVSFLFLSTVKSYLGKDRWTSETVADEAVRVSERVSTSSTASKQVECQPVSVCESGIGRRSRLSQLILNQVACIRGSNDETRPTLPNLRRSKKNPFHLYSFQSVPPTPRTPPRTSYKTSHLSAISAEPIHAWPNGRLNRSLPPTR